MNKKFILLFFFFLITNTLLSKEKISVRFENGTIFLAELAITQKEKELGLSFRKKKNNFALLFWYDKISEQIFWMKNMNFAIDILWIKNNEVVWVEENVPAPNKLFKQANIPTYGHGVFANKVLELPAGSSKKNKIKKGHKVYFEKLKY